jgi:prepilin-type processing-associated H-X9-DG protein
LSTPSRPKPHKKHLSHELATLRAGFLFGCLPIGVVCLVWFQVGLFTSEETERRVECSSNEKQMGLGLLQYSDDYDQTLPNSSTWMDTIHPYTRVDFACPDVRWPGPAGYGYAFNSRLSGKKIDSTTSQADTPIIYDSTDLHRNATDPLTSPPSPPRHDGGNNFLILDGHVRWFRGR